MSDLTITAAQIGKEATMLGAWIQAISTSFSAIIAGFTAYGVAYFTILRPIANQRREKTEQTLSLIMNSAHDGWENSQETIEDIEKTQKLLDEFMDMLAYCRRDSQDSDFFPAEKCLKRGWVDTSDSSLFEDMAREVTETSLSLNNHVDMAKIATNEMSRINPKIALYCMNEDHACRDLDLIGLKFLEVLINLRLHLAKLRFRRISFQILARDCSEEMTICYATCDQLDILLKTYKATLESSQKISATLEDLCKSEIKNLKKVLYRYN